MRKSYLVRKSYPVRKSYLVLICLAFCRISNRLKLYFMILAAVKKPNLYHDEASAQAVVHKKKPHSVAAHTTTSLSLKKSSFLHHLVSFAPCIPFVLLSLILRMPSNSWVSRISRDSITGSYMPSALGLVDMTKGGSRYNGPRN